MIKPTVGRIVWFTPDLDDTLISGNEDGIYAAIVTKVWDDTRVNLAVFTAKGVNAARTSVRLLQEGDEKPERGGFCQWMPYQIGQAKKHSDSSMPFLGETSDSAKDSSPASEPSPTPIAPTTEPSPPADTVPAADSQDVGSSETIASTEGVAPQESASPSA